MTAILTMTRSATKRLTIHVLLAAFLTFAAAASGCGAEAAFDCSSICDRYQTCFDSNYDTGSCASRCRDNEHSDSDYTNKADVCHSCIDDKSCASATFNCATKCAGIVP
jgi:hypothetical protein